MTSQMRNTKTSFERVEATTPMEAYLMKKVSKLEEAVKYSNFRLNELAAVHQNSIIEWELSEQRISVLERTNKMLVKELEKLKLCKRMDQFVITEDMNEVEDNEQDWMDQEMTFLKDQTKKIKKVLKVFENSNEHDQRILLQNELCSMEPKRETRIHPVPESRSETDNSHAKAHTLPSPPLRSQNQRQHALKEQSSQMMIAKRPNQLEDCDEQELPPAPQQAVHLCTLMELKSALMRKRRSKPGLELALEEHSSALSLNDLSTPNDGESRAEKMQAKELEAMLCRYAEEISDLKQKQKQLLESNEMLRNEKKGIESILHSQHNIVQTFLENKLHPPPEE